ncbi:MAG TPA: hypothetical protein VJQ45_05625 [Ktedonobacterales bacterium]|nr:hypothetical protein [Ktedonobacterales bacterium]
MAAAGGPVAGADTRLRGRTLALARVVWLLVTAAVVALDIAGIPATYTKFGTICLHCQPDNGQPTVGQAHALHAMGISLHFWASYETAIVVVTMLVYIGMGTLLFIRRSDDRMALFASLTLVTFGGAAVTGSMQALPDFYPALWVPVYAADAIGQIAFLVFFYVFPDGRFVPRWIALLALLWSLSWLVGFFRGSALEQAAQTVINGPLFAVVIASVIIAQVYRYRRVSTPRQREQTKWVVYGFSLALSGFLVFLIVGNVILPTSALDSPILQLVADAAVYALFLLIPIAIAVAILRSGLYDIDVLINRTLVYGSLTVLLAAVYFGSVVGMQQIARAVTGRGEQNTLVIVLSTLLIAALFTPLRRRLQRTIDRRFYRARYDTARTLERFGATLRTQTDLPQLTDHLVVVVDETMRPAHVSLWLRQPGGREPNER